MSGVGFKPMIPVFERSRSASLPCGHSDSGLIKLHKYLNKTIFCGGSYGSGVVVVLHLVNPTLRMRWAGHVACMGEVRVHTTFWLGGLKEGDH
jgi:hypothetical protein